MEKLKAKHDHKLTDILKVAIFGLMLILPGLILLPSMLYYGVNEHATAPTEQVEKIEYERVDFNQLINVENETYTYNNLTVEVQKPYVKFNGTSSGSFWYSSNNVNIQANHKYLFKGLTNANLYIIVGGSNTWSTPVESGNIFTVAWNDNNKIGFTGNDTFNNVSFIPQLFDLTQMFGIGNEPTVQEFNEWYTNDYYEYTQSRYEILEIPTGTYETYTDITNQIQFNWNSLWQQPLFSWTNYTILKQGLDNFTYVFGITQTSYITNLITYELIMVAIYIVIDIVLTLFKWLTHLIGEK